MEKAHIDYKEAFVMMRNRTEKKLLPYIAAQDCL